MTDGRDWIGEEEGTCERERTPEIWITIIALQQQGRHQSQKQRFLD